MPRFPEIAVSASSARTIEPPFTRRAMPQPTRIAVGPSCNRRAMSSATAGDTSASSHQLETGCVNASARNSGTLSQYFSNPDSVQPSSNSSRATAIASEKSPPGRGCTKTSQSRAVLCQTGSIRSFEARASFSTGTRCGDEMTGFFPQRMMLREDNRSKMSCESSSPKSSICASSPAPEQMSPRLVVTGPSFSKK